MCAGFISDIYCLYSDNMINLYLTFIVLGRSLNSKYGVIVELSPDTLYRNEVMLKRERESVSEEYQKA